MTPEGHTTISAAFENNDFSASVYPRPEIGEDIRFVEIRQGTASFIDFRKSLNILDRAGLMYNEDAPQDVSGDKPQLEFVTREPNTGLAIFKDRNAKR